MSKKNSNESDILYSIWRLKWTVVIGMMIVTGGVMAFGLVGAVAFHFNDENSISMLGMILPMIVVCILVLLIIDSHIRKKMKKIIDGIHEVAEGNFDYRIDLKDAEEYHQLYEDFNMMATELYRTRKEMDSFVNEFAHEFKTPITSISGFAKLLYETGEGIEDDERMQYLQMIAEQSERLCSLSQNTLLLSKVNAMQIISDRERYDICEQIRRCVILLSDGIEEKHLNVGIPEDCVMMYYGNQELLEHVWINLLSNAVKYTPEGGDIVIRFEENTDVISISISDTGTGMDEETVSRIFDRYYQHDTVSLTRGNGIGLAIVKRITELSGGDITVESAPGSGSTFTVKLPK